MFDSVFRWFENKHRSPETRLSQLQVLAIAREAAGDDPASRCLSMATPRFGEADHVIWEVSSATIGRTLVIMIDDIDGRVIEIKTLGVR
jgi:hypothetical protein